MLNDSLFYIALQYFVSTQISNFVIDVEMYTYKAILMKWSLNLTANGR